MPVITHTLRAIFAYPFTMKIWDKLSRRLSISTWKKSVSAHANSARPDLP